MHKKSWNKQQLVYAVKTSKSIRKVLKLLGLKPAGGNYKQVEKYIQFYGLSTAHFTGKLWNKGTKLGSKPRIPLYKILVKDSSYQSHKLKKRLFQQGLKSMVCEECGWHTQTCDGRVPVELDHINGDSKDNRFENLRILCPNCHSLKESHRGKNIGKFRKV
ncbi:hypothetical protein A2473_00790 [candidate division WWE3 bacterium RIFOXYC2_FULL_42_13]|uniref:HNH nuclease domain-containing protein n=1 Tax=candidate division WWE3 bacterium TaxID=2053526 RepID=A0A3D0ZQN3_UNCKA|nr:MAG: hypothetical protein A2245_01195 [candidate division WWE3 bacterium RIFOXYA2_FULL_43_12]OGC72777.1 MAG: hypothetical protein A2473_00790 [candidate division WWE3 bacterium RIFOXYC2_FULL_42_13]OGC72931.1 MAG: hypothetical protein A2337_04020 [candidate division WWE3 bacterium RIFOXYB2_FULL_43_9]OGC75065.1 MAG: hypothetical protein A2547_01170 [candidate division WWE3 bacterium RIFOXYD2_FULL_43_10]HBY10431.1 hypothetical protein [candidate division WWE3 bacterium]